MKNNDHSKIGVWLFLIGWVFAIYLALGYENGGGPLSLLVVGGGAAFMFYDSAQYSKLKDAQERAREQEERHKDGFD